MKIRSIWVGVIVLGIALYLGVFSGFSDFTIFFNVHALGLVIGGTIAITLISYSFPMISGLFDFLVYGFIFKKGAHDLNVLFDLLVSIYKNRSPVFDPLKKKYEHNFIKDGILLLRNPQLSEDDVYHALEMRKEAFRVKYSAHAKVLLNISKYPPALGLLGASTGMILMMMNLGTGGPEAIGKAMAVALTATFWGIGVANFVFLPLSDYAFQLAEDDNHLREAIVEVFLKEKSHSNFEGLIEIVAYRMDVAEQVRFRQSIAQFLQNEKREQDEKYLNVTETDGERAS
jgi:chemotaxis protein MotA